eukprot:15100.XXX_944263_944391_1 [CDS] Oithona nana genome sequencing.
MYHFFWLSFSHGQSSHFCRHRFHGMMYESSKALQATKCLFGP